ncbi:MAG: hypothetical protein ACLQIQ_20145 [Beijerinckiaceae bacterium]
MEWAEEVELLVVDRLSFRRPRPPPAQNAFGKPACRRMALAVWRLEDLYRTRLEFISDFKQSILQKAFSGELTSPPSQAIKEAAE